MRYGIFPLVLAVSLNYAVGPCVSAAAGAEEQQNAAVIVEQRAKDLKSRIDSLECSYQTHRKRAIFYQREADRVFTYDKAGYRRYMEQAQDHAFKACSFYKQLQLACRERDAVQSDQEIPLNSDTRLGE